MNEYDIIIIGTGAGGGTLAYALKDAGAKILILERGDFLPQEKENWQVESVFKENRYKPEEAWYSHTGEAFKPGVHYYVGGNTKVYGAALPRFREQDFEVLEHEGGTSPAWPISYEDLEPYYTEAEKLFRVHGTVGEDPTEPPRSTDFPFPAVPHEPYIAKLIDKLRAQGLHPFSYPMGIDLRDGGRCIRCKTCDGFPCKVLAKSDADTCVVRPALESPDVTLWTKSFVKRLITTLDGRRIAGVEVEKEGETVQVSADIVISACGTVNSTALLLRSANSAHPEGLANKTGLVGRNYMVHNNTALMAVNPFLANPTVFQKTTAINDYYFKGPEFNYPMGNIQALGKLQAGMLAASKPFMPKPILQAMANRSVDWWVMSEDLPDPENRVTLGSDGRIIVRWQANNLVAHEKLIEAAKTMMRQAGYPIVIAERMGIATNSHQCGTIRFGNDPETSVLDPFCRAWEVDNLYVVDGSFFPSSTAMNPALTIAAQALRVADHLKGKLRA
ncbi:MAG: GMC family oxidoreductase [Trueperaceae bacterium]|nr:GMC family oxidoreductase [Trueperaceae bacterium]